MINNFNRNICILGILLIVTLMVLYIIQDDPIPVASASSRYDTMTLLETYETFPDYMGSNVYVLHDDKRGVTCWTRSRGYDGTMSCIADSQLKPN